MTANIILVVGTVVVWILYDVVRAFRGQQTISEFFYVNSQKYPIVTWAVGFLFGFLSAHFYFPAH